jgi:hypothetical protein
MMFFDKLFTRSVYHTDDYREYGLGVYGRKSLATITLYDRHDRTLGGSLYLSLDAPNVFLSVQLWKKCFTLAINDEFE